MANAKNLSSNSSTDHDAAVAAESISHVDHVETVAHTEAHGDGHHEAGSPMDVSGEMFVWTLGTFIVMGFLLTKLAWKPILQGLDEREQNIRDSVENAEKIQVELASIDGQRSEIISAADEKAKGIVERARRAGKEAERVLKDKAKEDATILVENAERQIRTARDKAAADLRRDSVDMTLELTGKLIGETMDDDRHRALTDKLISEM